MGWNLFVDQGWLVLCGSLVFGVMFVDWFDVRVNQATK